MKNILLFVVCMSWVVNSLAQTTINPENKKVWKLVWKDDFNYKKRADLLKVCVWSIARKAAADRIGHPEVCGQDAIFNMDILNVDTNTLLQQVPIIRSGS